jgi:hypothetical protein
MRTPKGRLVAKYESRSRPGTIYDVREAADGSLACTCPAWIYKAGGRRSCKHVEDAARTAYVGPFEVADVLNSDEMFAIAEDPSAADRWLEDHLKPRRV